MTTSTEKRILARVQEDTAKLQEIAEKKARREEKRRQAAEKDFAAKSLRFARRIKKLKQEFLKSLTREQAGWHKLEEEAALDEQAHIIKSAVDRALGEKAESDRQWERNQPMSNEEYRERTR